jgi:hypothetical protein
MANKFTRYLTSFASGLGSGLVNPKGIMSDYRHGRRLFVDNTMRLAPRQKFQFYVNFELDKRAVRSTQFLDKHSQEVGFLVKTADLPKYTFDSMIKNQYNRKKIVYKQINYDPLNISFHDDSAGIVNALWSLYYGYYIKDRHNPLAAYGETKYRPTKTPSDNFRYGLDNQVGPGFFKTISLYTMSRRRFLGYTLVNPRIKSWGHSQGDYALSEAMEHTMSLEYEAVIYSGGRVSRNSPKGFATLHYDNLPSPLSIAGGGLSRLTGEGGVLDGLEQIFGDVASGNAFASPGNFLSTAIKAVNTYKQGGKLNSARLGAEALSILSSPAGISAGASVIGGIAGAIFPKQNPANEPTVAAPKRTIATAAFTGQPVTAPGE